jgi:hypothetical protein
MKYLAHVGKREHYDVYIGRPSIFGNPFIVGEHGDRKTCVRMYVEWLRDQPQVLSLLPQLRGKILGCWCGEKLCHGEVLAALANDEPFSPRLQRLFSSC